MDVSLFDRTRVRNNSAANKFRKELTMVGENFWWNKKKIKKETMSEKLMKKNTSKR